MKKEDLRNLVKLNIDMRSGAYDDLIAHDIETAKKEIEKEGISLMDEVDDDNLVIMYASYLFLKRKTGDPMPRTLRYALNNRLFAQKSSGGECDDWKWSVQLP